MRLRTQALVGVLFLVGCTPTGPGCETYISLGEMSDDAAKREASSMSGESLVSAYRCGVRSVHPSDTAVAEFFAGREEEIAPILRRQVSSTKNSKEVFYMTSAAYRMAKANRQLYSIADRQEFVRQCQAFDNKDSPCLRLATTMPVRDAGANQ